MKKHTKSISGDKEYLKTKLKHLKGIIFDCDGVLINSKASNVEFYNFIKRKLGLPLMNKKEEDFVHTHTVYESIKFIIPEEKLEEAINISQNIPYKDILKLITLEDGLMDFLNLLKRVRIKCAINTNRTTTMDLILDKFGLRGYFSPVVTANNLKHPKPHPESINYILNLWSFKPEEVAYLGDSVVDEKTAKNSTVDFWSYKNPDLDSVLYVPDYHTLIDLFLNLKS